METFQETVAYKMIKINQNVDVVINMICDYVPL